MLYRRPNYDAGLFVEAFDDDNARRGYGLYKVGCRGPVTYNACGVIRWNGGVSFPIQSGHGCIGCSEAHFWDNGPFYQQLASFPGFGIETTADTVGTWVAGATAVGIAAHAITTNLRKRDMNGNGAHPRDAAGQRSAYEAALVGTRVADPEQPLEVLRTIHSFDPCIACAVHLHDGRGYHAHQIRVV